MSDFSKFVTGLLKRGNVKDEYIAMFITKENMIEFKKAFTHSSADPVNNYEMYEFLGDVVINSSIAFYIRWRFPRIVNVNWLTKIKAYMVSGRMLAKLAYDNGLSDYVIYGDEMKEKIEKNKNLLTNIDYLKMLEDVMEAFMGCMVTIIMNSGKSYGVGMQIANDIVVSFLNRTPISIKYEVIFDPITRLKELYESKARGLKWPVNAIYKKIKHPDKTITIEVYGWPLTDKKYDPEEPTKNRVLLSKGTGAVADEVQVKVSLEALSQLDRKYEIKEIPSSPYLM